MNLIAGNNTLNVAMIPIPVVSFDPWIYDANESCYIELSELVQSSNDYFVGLITQAQFLEVRALYDNQTRNPACEVPPPPPTDYLLMSKDELYSHLINGSVANDWWALSYEQRRQLGLNIIQWWSVEWFGMGVCIATGEPNCGGPPTVNPYDDPSICVYKKIGLGMETCAGFRYCLFTDNSVAPRNLYWWRLFNGGEWICYDPGVSFSLPTAVAIWDADWLNCLQIAKDVTKLDSWIFFQTWMADGYPGIDAHHWPILSGGIRILKVKGILKKASGEFDPRGIADLGDLIAEIHY